ncbi:porin family protein [Flavobacterium sp. JP2137]|uniref:porin family protein n=1 Tax=Flavobacterium sp. JP2137 TaxID=3414510 RepID=UPI003D3008BC
MIKKTVLFILILLSGWGTTAQILSFGLKGGVNYANFTGKSVSSDAITSFHFGATAELRLTEKLALQPELLYSTVGANYQNTVGDITREIKSKLGYIAIPVLAKINLNRSITLEAGPQFSFLMSKKNEFKPGDTNSYETAIIAGLGLKLTQSVFIQARYGFGLTKIAEDSNVKNAVGQISLGFLL